LPIGDSKVAKTQYIYQIDDPKAFKLDKWILGGKGYNLMRMTRMGLPVPIAFIVTTEACREYMKNGRKFFSSLEKEILQNVILLEKKVGRKFSTNNDALLVSVRSGAPFSMPGMMDTILNLGLNDSNTESLKKITNDGRFAYDCYRRFLTMFGDVALHIRGDGEDPFDAIVNAARKKAEVKTDADLNEEDWIDVCDKMKTLIKQKSGKAVPGDPVKQVLLAIEAVFKSWDNPRAKTYRKLNNIPDDLGTGVIIQQMVFGNRDEKSASGVAFTRDPGNGERKVFGEYLLKAQGEDVVAGIRTPIKLDEMDCQLPKNYKQFLAICKKLELNYKDMQDIEFTIESGKLYILQTRSGKRTAHAAVKIAVDMFREKLIDRDTAISRVDPDSLDQLLHPVIDPNVSYKEKILACGIPASPGAAVGVIVFSADRAAEMVGANKAAKIILVSEETTPDDIHGMAAAKGILTSRGGKTAHAAVVARGMGKPCICGCTELKIDFKSRTISIGDKECKEGDWITIEGTRGDVIEGQLPLIPAEISGDLKKLLDWSDAVCAETNGLYVRTNVDTPIDARRAREMGAKGIGLCRTEHMFMGERADLVAELILILTKHGELTKDDTARKKKILGELLKLQFQDFIGIFKAMDGYPVTIRLIDPPLHEFLPEEEELEERIKKAHHSPGGRVEIKRLQTMLSRRKEFHEQNPMLGLRGCRLGIRYPEINRMQIEAIFRAAVKAQNDGVKVFPEIMIPLSSMASELVVLRKMVREIAGDVFEETKTSVPYMYGTMIEVPRAALVADEIARETEFFSFGTNDMTQMTYGISRDDAEEKFLRFYESEKIMKSNPFEKLDQAGVGQLMELAIKKGRSTNPNIKLGICGEHGGEPSSVIFCHKIGLAYVSCSPFRVPVARLAAAHAILKFPRASVKKAKSSKGNASKKTAATTKKTVKRSVKKK
jgi:pyruvate,orthophosphate dikinase